MSRRACVAAVSLCTAFFVGCVTTAHGTYHVVQSGENLYRISAHYRVPVDEIVAVNDIRNVRDLRVGSEIWIPGAHPDDRTEYPLRPPEHVLRELRSPDVAAGYQTRGSRGGRGDVAPGAPPLAWPLSNPITSKYGPRWGRMHQGVDFGAPSGTPIRSSAAGRVIFAGRMGGYGNVLIVKHRGGVSTVYAHNRRHHVGKGDTVRKGEVIAEVGRSGNATGPNLHFEVRVGDAPVDPLRYLP